MSAFDAYLLVDWSAAARRRRGADSIWIGEARRRGRRVELREAANPASRRQAAAEVAARLRAHLGAGRRVLVGFDFAYGYPRGLARALGLAPGPAWRRTAEALSAQLRDDERNRNQRFAAAAALNARIGAGPGPFWGCPPRRATRSLRPTSPGFPYPSARGPALERLRAAERRRSGVQEVWKLLGAGSVGSQALVGIPYLLALRDEPALAAVSRVWPFETGFTPAPTGGGVRVVHAEIWPGVIELEARLHPVRDAAQVLGLARQLAERDVRGELGPLFAAPPELPAAERRACLGEEGWILGA